MGAVDGPATESRPPARSDRLPANTGEPARSTRGDQFRTQGALERFVQAINRRVEHGWLQQSFRLPGHGRVVHDFRDGRPADESGLPEANTPTPAATPRTGFFRDRSAVLPQAQATETPAHVTEKLLSAFERAIVARFEEGAAAPGDMPAGHKQFLQKTAAVWKDFFLRFLHRTVKKEVDLAALDSHLWFRGLLQKKSAPNVGVLIADLVFQDGQLEKFARMEVPLAQWLQALPGQQPGAQLASQLLKQHADQQQLQYFAIETPHEAIAGARSETAGIFTSLKREAEIAERLRFTRGKSTAPLGGFAGRAASSDDDEIKNRFVPWWRIDREERAGLPRWFVPVAIGTIVAAMAMAAIFYW